LVTLTTRPIPERHWRSYGNDPLPTGREAMDEPFRAFPSWFLRIECDHCDAVKQFDAVNPGRGTSKYPAVRQLG
jgi:hypothetical protein